jgi:alanine dehydrogenase
VSGSILFLSAAEVAEALFMPVHLPEQGRLGLKVATVVPDNPGRNLPTIQALVAVFDADPAPGTHVNAIGSYRPDAREIPGATVARARLVVDSRETYLREAGELVMALEEGLLAADTIPAELGEVVAGSEPGRRDDDQLTLFKSVGNAVQDLAAAGVVLEAARRLGLGTEVEL